MGWQTGPHPLPFSLREKGKTREFVPLPEGEGPRSRSERRVRAFGISRDEAIRFLRVEFVFTHPVEVRLQQVAGEQVEQPVTDI